MGYHYVPKYYLRGFEELNNPKMIWMYDKKLHRATNASITSVAQESSFYEKEIERKLNETVEKPANKILRKIRSGSIINHNERDIFVLYIGTMLMRVPKKRTMATDLYPDVLEGTLAKIEEIINQWAKKKDLNSSIVELRRDQLDRVAKDLQESIPQEISQQIRNPWPSNRILKCIRYMTWRVVTSSGAFFISSDSPVHYFDSLGIGNKESEMVFPLSSDFALHTSYQGEPGATYYLEVKPKTVREFNRRIASGAERFVFTKKMENWISTISSKKYPYLSRIQW